MSYLQLRSLVINPIKGDQTGIVLSVLGDRDKASERQYFTEAEAMTLVGTPIRSQRAWSGIREGSTGRVSRAAESASRYG